MSYILDALKKSEQARRGARTNRDFEAPPESARHGSRTSANLPRWLYPLAFIGLVSLAVFIFRAVPWQNGAPPPKARPPARGSAAAPPESTRGTDTVPAKAASPPPRPSNCEKTPDISPGGPPAPQVIAPPRPTATVSPHPSPAAGQALGRVDITPRKPRPLQPPDAVPTPKTALAKKTADLKALLQKQANHAPKTAEPAVSGQDLVRPGALTGSDFSESPAPAVPSMSRLPAQVLSTLPPISVSMLVYSDRPADRFIYVNGSKKHEGDEVSAGLKLVRITRDGAIFTYLGRRFYKGVLGN